MKALARRTAAVAATMTLTLAISPSAALAAGAKKVTQSDATLLADGAAVTLPATFTCPAGYMAYLTAQIVQAIGQDFAGGFDTTAKECTGKKQKLTFFIQAAPAGDNTRPFEVGTASSRVIMDAVDPAAQDPYGPYVEDDGSGDGSGEDPGPLGGLPPLPGASPAQYSTIDDPMPTEPPAPSPTVHGEARGVIEIKEKSGS